MVREEIPQGAPGDKKVEVWAGRKSKSEKRRRKSTVRLGPGEEEQVATGKDPRGIPPLRDPAR